MPPLWRRQWQGRDQAHTQWEAAAALQAQGDGADLQGATFTTVTVGMQTKRQRVLSVGGLMERAG